ncbi:MAG: hypothetical protein ACI90V_004574, partial [Bacillariaceae sp.]
DRKQRKGVGVIKAVNSEVKRWKSHFFYFSFT